MKKGLITPDEWKNVEPSMEKFNKKMIQNNIEPKKRCTKLIDHVSKKLNKPLNIKDFIKIEEWIWDNIR